MAPHGYLREFDEGYDRDEDRERNEDRRSRLMFEGEDRSGQGYGPEHGYGGFQGDYGGGFEQGGFGSRGDYARRRTSFTSHPDEHYRSWRDKQITAMDRDYEDYRREREQEFNKDFESWRRSGAPTRPRSRRG